MPDPCPVGRRQLLPELLVSPRNVHTPDAYGRLAPFADEDAAAVRAPRDGILRARAIDAKQGPRLTTGERIQGERRAVGDARVSNDEASVRRNRLRLNREGGAFGRNGDR